MSLSRTTYRPRIAHGIGFEEYVSLPTGALQWNETFTYELEQSVPPGGTGSVVTGFRKGPTQIIITGEIQSDDPDSVEEILRSIEAAIDSGSFRLFSHFDKSSDTYRYYQNCYATEFSSDLKAGDFYRPGRDTGFTLKVIAADPVVYGSEPEPNSNEFEGDVTFKPGASGMIRVLNPDSEVVAQFEPLTGTLKISGFVFEQYLFE